MGVIIDYTAPNYTPLQNILNHLQSWTKEKVMGIISWIVFGLIAGILAKWIMPGSDPGGIIV